MVAIFELFKNGEAILGPLTWDPSWFGPFVCLSELLLAHIHIDNVWAAEAPTSGLARVLPRGVFDCSNAASSATATQVSSFAQQSKQESRNPSFQMSAHSHSLSVLKKNLKFSYCCFIDLLSCLPLQLVHWADLLHFLLSYCWGLFGRPIFLSGSQGKMSVCP